MKLAILILRPVAIVTLSLIYMTVFAISLARPKRDNKTFKKRGRILVIGTFHNPNWFQSHIVPLARCAVGEVILVCDAPVFELDNIKYVCPPRIMNILFTRALAKLIYAFTNSIRYRPDMFMGYHIFPGAISALVLGSIFNRPACYQDTSGPLELSGGGWQAENRLLVALGGPSNVVEKAVFAVVRRFDMIVVRGNSAKQFIENLGYKGFLTIITGSIDIKEAWNELENRDIDLIFVGRLIKAKNPLVFIDVVLKLKNDLVDIRAVVIGDGPDKNELVDYCKDNGLETNVEILGQRNDVMDWYRRSKVFVLPSAWEGLSIAMIEAMASGTVPVVSDVGDLKDLVQQGKNGYLLDVTDIDGFSEHARDLLQDQKKWLALSKESRKSSLEYSGLEAVSIKWQENISRVVSG